MKSAMIRLHDTLGLRTNAVIFMASALVTLVFVVGTIAFTEPVDSFFAGLTDWIMENLG
jgi:choline/glycine/proline betaine transport protein